jgi:excisionase family DNA binding protein
MLVLFEAVNASDGDGKMADKQPWAGIPAQTPILRPSEAARHLGVSRSQFYTLVANGDLPRPFRIGERSVGLPKAWLDSVVAARFAESLEAVR